jgi:hypothetical protein
LETLQKDSKTIINSENDSEATSIATIKGYPIRVCNKYLEQNELNVECIELEQVTDTLHLYFLTICLCNDVIVVANNKTGIKEFHG